MTRKKKRPKDGAAGHWPSVRVPPDAMEAIDKLHLMYQDLEGREIPRYLVVTTGLGLLRETLERKLRFRDHERRQR